MGYVSENYWEVKQRVEQACQRANRDPKEVTLIAVSKTKPVENIEELVEIGVKDFGENKVQEMCMKIEAIQTPLRWHLIGHLQRNKVKFMMGQTYLLHSVDSVRLAAEIEKEAAKADCVCDCLVEVNIGDEESKSGVAYEEAVELIKEIRQFPHVHVKGLMCIAPFTEEPESNRVHFKRMRQLKESIAALQLENVEMTELSMGMTGDFEVAIEEGATFVRVGTAIFGQRNYQK